MTARGNLKWVLGLAGVMVAPVCAVAQATAGQPPEISEGAFFFQTLLYISVGFLCFHFLITRPAQQRDENRKNFLAKLKKNDEVMTAGGILGRVHSIAADSVTVEIASNVRVRVHPEYLLDAGQAATTSTQTEAKAQSGGKS